MSIHICSQDLHTGKLSNGTWTFSKTLQGDYVVSYQHMEVADIPWVFPGCNELYIVNAAIPSQNSTVSFPTSYDSSSSAVQTWFTNAINATGWLSVLSSSYDPIANRYSFLFDKLVSVYTSQEVSSIAPVFDWVYNAPIHSNPITYFTISAK